MPDQNQTNTTQDPTTTTPSVAPVEPVTPAAPVAPAENTPASPSIFPQSDLPPLPPEFQTLGQTTPPATPGPDTGSAAPPDLKSILPSKPKKKFGGGRIIATILGLVVLVGGIGAGIVLTQQQQLFQQKAACATGNTGTTGACCSNGKLEVWYQDGTTKADGSCNKEKKCSNTPCVNPNQNDTDTVPDAPAPAPPATITCPQAPDTVKYGCLAGKCYTLKGRVCGEGAGQYCCNGEVALSFCPGGTCGTVPPPADPSNPSGTGSWPPNGTQCTHVGGGSSTIGGCVKYICPNGCGGNGKCGEEDSGVQISFANCSSSQSDIESRNLCGQVDTVDTSRTYCMPSGGYKDSFIRCPANCTSPDSPNTPTTPPSNPTAPSCVAVKAYDEAFTKQLSGAELSALKAGAKINFCVTAAVGSSGSYSKAMFKVNTTVGAEITSPRTANEYCTSYTIKATDVTVSVLAKVYHSASGWVGETF